MGNHVYPWWLGYFLLNPLRYLTDPPQKLLAAHVCEGMQALDVGCGPGFHSLPMARLVGQAGRVHCVDLQPEMIAILRNRAKRAGLLDRVVTSVCSPDSLALDDLKVEFDFVLASGVVHEVPDPPRFFAELAAALIPSGSVLLAEPKEHVSQEEFTITISIAKQHGFKIAEEPKIFRSRSVVLKKAQHQ